MAKGTPAPAASTEVVVSAPLRIRILVDNHARVQGHLAQHGFSAFCEVGGTAILFDTGATGEVLTRNASAMGVDLSAVGDVALSHGHWDHGGGLVEALDSCESARAWIPAGALMPRWSRGSDGVPRDIALPAAVRNRLVRDRRRWTEIDGPTRLADGIWLTGPVAGVRPAWTHAGLVRNPAMDIPDDVPEEQALVFETAKGLVVVAGCAHYGIPNLLAHLERMLPGSRVRTLVGGLHLEAAGAQELETISRAMADFGVDAVVPCHCSGPGAAVRLAALGLACEQGRVGWDRVFAD